MHAHELFLRSASFKQGDVKYDAISIAYRIPEQQVVLDFDKELTVGPASITMSFQGVLNDNLCGFYRSKYTVKGQTRYMAVTQFEATDARRALPWYVNMYCIFYLVILLSAAILYYCHEYITHITYPVTKHEII